MTRGISSFWLSALAVVASASIAAAADQAVVLKAPKAAEEAVEYGNLYFGYDWTSHRSLAGYTGVLYAPQGMDKSGIRLSAFGLVGDYKYNGDIGESFKGRFVSTDALVGWSNVFNNGAFTLQVGVNYQDHHVTPFDPNNSVQGAKAGFKVQGDVWVNPTERTLVYALGSYSTAFNTYYAVGRLGYDFLHNEVFFGPEVGGLGNDRTDQFRLGAHVSDIKVGPAKLTISGGWMRERNEGGGAYSMATLDFSF
jgi:opacity protein-like surface antigen